MLFAVLPTPTVAKSPLSGIEKIGGIGHFLSGHPGRVSQTLTQYGEEGDCSDGLLSPVRRHLTLEPAVVLQRHISYLQVVDAGGRVAQQTVPWVARHRPRVACERRRILVFKQNDIQLVSTKTLLSCCRTDDFQRHHKCASRKLPEIIRSDQIRSDIFRSCHKVWMVL